MWGYLGYDESKKEDGEDADIDFDADIDYDSVMKARLQEQGVSLPPLADLYGKDGNKEDQISNFVEQYRVLLEFQRSLDCLPLGMYVSPSVTSMLTWHGVIFLRAGPYKGGIFKFQLELPEDYPEQPPTLHFLSDVFHPMVDRKTGHVDLDVWLTDWKPGHDCAASVLPRLHKALSQKDHIVEKGDAGMDALNTKARDLFLNNPVEFAARAKECVEASTSSSSCFENPEGALLRFAEGPTEQHEHLLKALRETDVGACTFEERRRMYVEWFCDHYVRNEILQGNKKKKKKKNRQDFSKMRDRRPTGGDLASLRKFAEQLAQEEEDESEDEEEEAKGKA